MQTSDGLPVLFRDLPAACYPFQVEFFDVDTGDVYETVRVEGPGMLRINPKPAHVRRAGTRISYGDGVVVSHDGGDAEPVVVQG